MKNLNLLICLFLISCTTIKIPKTSGGSRSDGIVELSYTVKSLENPQVDWGRAESTAIDSCKLWGYDSAKAFSGSTRECVYRHADLGCMTTEITAKYQCINN